jgi:hypothetical protein
MALISAALFSDAGGIGRGVEQGPYGPGDAGGGGQWIRPFEDEVERAASGVGPQAGARSHK